MAKRRSTGLEAWLNASQSPVYVLDLKRRVTLFSSGCETLTGWSADEVIGRLCHYTSEDDSTVIEGLLASICPPSAVFDGEYQAVPNFIAHRDGSTTAKLLHHYPLQNRDGKVDRVLTVALPLENPVPSAASSPAQRLHAELAALRGEIRRRFGFTTTVAQAESMQRVLSQMQFAAGAIASVHVVGDAGTGCEHVARVIHNESETRARSFVPLDCKRLTAAELMRTVRRLFDTPEDAAAKLPHLRVGTLLLHNVQHMPRDVQVVIADEWEAAGQFEAIRLVTSADLSLVELMRGDAVLPELLSLAGTLEIRLPSLIERIDDLAPLAQLFLEQLNPRAENTVDGFDEEVLAEFMQYNWPGNVGELKQVVQEAHSTCKTRIIETSDLPLRFRTGMDARRSGPTVLRDTELEPLLARVEAEQILRVLDPCGGNRTEAAKLLGLTRPKLYRRLEQLGLAGE